MKVNLKIGKQRLQTRHQDKGNKTMENLAVPLFRDAFNFRVYFLELRDNGVFQTVAASARQE